MDQKEEAKAPAVATVDLQNTIDQIAEICHLNEQDMSQGLRRFIDHRQDQQATEAIKLIGQWMNQIPVIVSNVSLLKDLRAMINKQIEVAESLKTILGTAEVLADPSQSFQWEQMGVRASEVLSSIEERHDEVMKQMISSLNGLCEETIFLFDKAEERPLREMHDMEEKIDIHDIESPPVYGYDEHDEATLRSASRAGDVDAMVELAKLLLREFPSSEEAVQLLREASRENHPEGMYLLGKAFFEGVGVQKNISTAKFWVKASSRLNFQAAKEMEIELSKHDHPDRRWSFPDMEDEVAAFMKEEKANAVKAEVEEKEDIDPLSPRIIPRNDEIPDAVPDEVPKVPNPNKPVLDHEDILGLLGEMSPKPIPKQKPPKDEHDHLSFIFGDGNANIAQASPFDPWEPEEETIEDIRHRLHPILQNWRMGKSGAPKQITGLLLSVNQVLWDDSKLRNKPIGLGDVSDAKSLKRAVRRVQLETHPDKHSRSSPEVQVISEFVFDAVNQAYDEHMNNN